MMKVSANLQEVHHKGKKRIFHCYLAVLSLPEAEKIRSGVFRVASFAGDHLCKVSISGPQKRILASLVLAWALVQGSGTIGTITTNYWLAPSSAHQWHAASCLSLKTGSTKKCKSSCSTTPRQDLFSSFLWLLKPIEGEHIAEAANSRVVLFCLAIA